MKKPNNTTKDVAKSLHTVTAIYQVARALGPTSGNSFAEIMEEAVERAMQVLELAGRPDPYGLRDRAVALLLADLAETPEAKLAAQDRVRSVGGKTKITGRDYEGEPRSRHALAGVTKREA